MATKGILCKYYMNGVCKYGENCLFSHDKQELPNLVCTYYLAGCCVYGDKCRYNHAKPEWFKQQQVPAPSSYTPPAVPKPPVSEITELTAPSDQESTPDVSAHVELRPIGAPKTSGIGARPNLSEVLTGTASSGVTSRAIDCEEEWEEDPDAYGEGEEQAYVEAPAANGNGYHSAYIATDGSTYYSQPTGYSEQCNGEYYVYDPSSSSYMQAYHGYDANGEGYEGYEGSTEQYEDGAWQEGDEGAVVEGDWSSGPAGSMTDPADLPLCSHFSATGTCPRGDFCRLIHGNLCEICDKFALHPYNESEAASHSRQCRSRHDKLAARLRSGSVECCICLERVLGKAEPSQRRFGLMFCEHAFCLSCIRNWRNTDEVDVDTALRTCPVCRTATHFITPSSVWPASAEEKDSIVNGYKKTLAGRHCRNFNFGDGKCPFGTSCFYRHEYRDGRAEEPMLRKVGNADGEVRFMKPLSLASFLDTPQARRLLTRRRR